MKRRSLHQALFWLLLIIGSIAIIGLLRNGQWSEVVTGILGIAGTILTLEVTKKEDEHE